MPSRYDPNTKAKAIRLVRAHRGDYPAEYAAITAVAGRLGMTPETLRRWLRQAEVDEGTSPGTSTAESAQIRGVHSRVRARDIRRLLVQVARVCRRGRRGWRRWRGYRVRVRLPGRSAPGSSRRGSRGYASSRRRPGAVSGL